MTEHPSPTPLIRIHHVETVGWLIINRPERRNALNRAMWEAIPEGINALVAEPAVRVIMIRGASEEAFASGADISEFSEMRSDSTAAKEYEALNGAAFAAIRAAEKPVIAMIHGYCFGGGLAIALACDLRIAAETAQFSLPPARLGLAYPLAGLADLLAAVPLSFAKEMIFTARRVSAAEALSAGLINQMTPPNGLDKVVTERCSEISAGAPLTIMASKAALDNLAGRMGAVSEADIETMMQACFDSADYAEGRAAFLAKRKPVFTGR